MITVVLGLWNVSLQRATGHQDLAKASIPIRMPLGMKNNIHICRDSPLEPSTKCRMISFVGVVATFPGP